MHVLEFPTNTILVLLRNNANFLFCTVKDLIFWDRFPFVRTMEERAMMPENKTRYMNFLTSLYPNIQAVSQIS